MLEKVNRKQILQSAVILKKRNSFVFDVFFDKLQRMKQFVDLVYEPGSEIGRLPQLI